MKQIFLTITFILALNGCASIELFDLQIEASEIVQREDSFFFSYAPESAMGRSNTSHKYLKLHVSSDKPLYNYLVEDWGRHIHVYCEITCVSCEQTSNIVAFGPYYGEIDISKIFLSDKSFRENSSKGRHKYSIYTFRNLESSEHFEHGKKIERVSAENFDAISCFISGTAYLTPGIYPRSNNVTFTKHDFKAAQTK